MINFVFETQEAVFPAIERQKLEVANLYDSVQS